MRHYLTEFLKKPTIAQLAAAGRRQETFEGFKKVRQGTKAHEDSSTSGGVLAAVFFAMVACGVDTATVSPLTPTVERAAERESEALASSPIPSWIETPAPTIASSPTEGPAQPTATPRPTASSTPEPVGLEVPWAKDGVARGE